MSESLSPFVFDASAENFDRLILGNSARGLVLAHFWSPRAGPCMLLMPRLLKLASEFTGRFLLVMVNTDELGRQARDLGVTSVPTVKFFLGGKVAHTIHGAESEEVFRTALRRFLADPREEPRLAALALHQAGDSEAAIAMLARLAVDHPLPAAARADAGVAPLLAHLELIDAARDDAAAATLAEREPAYRLSQAARALFDDDPESAMESLLDLAAQAPTYRDDIGRRALLALFGMLGPEHALTRRFRARLAALGS
ncbi:MAG: tetratricopeptide repeat protein [Thiobacillaceae bacterium]|nr:tetratricopeptide repeat protein [Thiobacillaceae bacterium]